MHTLTIPADAPVHGAIRNVDGSAREALTFREFWLAFVAGRLPHGDSSETAILVAVCGKLNECSAGDSVELSDAEHEALCKALPPSRSAASPDGVSTDLLVRVGTFFLAVQSA
jgi:hypothetical protein